MPRTGASSPPFPRSGKDGIAGRYLYVSQLESGPGLGPAGDGFRPEHGGAADRVPAGREESRRRGRESRSSSSATAMPARVSAWRATSPRRRSGPATSSSSLPGGGFTVDLASFIARDDLGLGQALKSGNAGDYSLVSDLELRRSRRRQGLSAQRRIERDPDLSRRATVGRRAQHRPRPDAEPQDPPLAHRLAGGRAISRDPTLMAIPSGRNRSTRPRRSASRWSAT